MKISLKFALLGMLSLSFMACSEDSSSSPTDSDFLGSGISSASRPNNANSSSSVDIQMDCGTLYKYNPTTEFCYSGNVYDLCGGEIYIPTQEFCDLGKVATLCGGSPYFSATEFCLGDKVYTLCGGAPYNPLVEFCYNGKPYELCGTKTYNPEAQFCLSGKIYNLCGGQRYAPTVEFCYSGSIVQKCSGLEYTPTTQFCYQNQRVINKCGSSEYNPNEKFCSASKLYDLCAGEIYDVNNYGCFVGVLKKKCGTVYYDTTTHACDFGVLKSYALEEDRTMVLTITSYREKGSSWDALGNAGDPIISFYFRAFDNDSTLLQNLHTGTLLSGSNISSWSGAKISRHKIPKGTRYLRILPDVLDEDVSFNDDYSSGYYFMFRNLGLLESGVVQKIEDTSGSNYSLYAEWYFE